MVKKNRVPLLDYWESINYSKNLVGRIQLSLERADEVHPLKWGMGCFERNNWNIKLENQLISADGDL